MVTTAEALYPPQGTAGAQLEAFQAKGWTPQAVAAEQLGWAYGYDEAGTLLGEVGMGGAASTGGKLYKVITVIPGRRR